MSSSYRALCLSHDPALVIDGAEWSTTTALEGALANPTAAPELAEHRTCDLLGGRYSYPLIEVYCPPVRDEHRHYPDHLRTGVWIGVEWLALLLATYDRTDGDVEALGRRMPGCWSRERLSRLRGELSP